MAGVRRRVDVGRGLAVGDGWAAVSERQVTPPFRADPDLIDHLEGYERTIRRYRKAAERMNAETADPFAEPVTFPSGVRWAPTDYKPLPEDVQERYRQFADTRGPNSE